MLYLEAENGTAENVEETGVKYIGRKKQMPLGPSYEDWLNSQKALTKKFSLWIRYTYTSQKNAMLNATTATSQLRDGQASQSNERKIKSVRDPS